MNSQTNNSLKNHQLSKDFTKTMDASTANESVARKRNITTCLPFNFNNKKTYSQKTTKNLEKYKGVDFLATTRCLETYRKDNCVNAKTQKNSIDFRVQHKEISSASRNSNSAFNLTKRLNSRPSFSKNHIRVRKTV